MTAEHTTNTMDTPFELPDELGIYAVTDLHRALSQQLDERAGNPDAAAVFRLDARRVATVDGAGLQLLMAFATEVHARGLSLSLVDVSTVLRQGLERLGLETAFNLDPVAAAA